MVKVKNGEQHKLSGKDILEGFTGAQFRAGASSYTIDRFFELLGQEGSITGEPQFFAFITPNFKKEYAKVKKKAGKGDKW